MGKISIVNSNEMPWKDGATRYVKDGKEFKVKSRFPIAHFENTLYFGSAKYQPNLRVEPHHHPCNEILYVTRGEMHLGKKVYKKGTAISVPEGTVYGPLIAGPNGVEFLTIRDKHPKGFFKPGEKAP
ncbi:MAG: cupin domain-containing protein [Dehalococcoidia bacterium]|nr:cupin domain-containing protein [Dehalococcoidia bacterium]